MTPGFVPRAITLDLDDTLWPVGPTLVAAERVLSDWLRPENVNIDYSGTAGRAGE